MIPCDLERTQRRHRGTGHPAILVYAFGVLLVAPQSPAGQSVSFLADFALCPVFLHSVAPKALLVAFR
jgi:hypothetical protein